jgi:iodotyrosine deiodinase
MTDTKLIEGFRHIRYEIEALPVQEIERQSRQFYQSMDSRRSVRDFSDKPISRAIIENLILTASTAPSGANKQPWTFCVIENPDLKKQIRTAAEEEEEERRSYSERMSDEWINDLKPLATDWQKPFLETAPYLVVLFSQSMGSDKQKHYYVQESVGIAAGFLIAAIHQAGLVTLTHTPSPMNFLKKILNRPDNERPFLLLPVGYPADETYVPDIHRKKMREVVVFY